MTFQKDFSVL